MDGTIAQPQDATAVSAWQREDKKALAATCLAFEPCALPRTVESKPPLQREKDGRDFNREFVMKRKVEHSRI